MAPHSAAVVPRVLVAQPPQEQRVTLHQLSSPAPCCPLLLHLPQHRGICRLLVLAGQCDIGSQAAQHRVPRQSWRNERGLGNEDETPGPVGVPGDGRHPVICSACPVTAGGQGTELESGIGSSHCGVWGVWWRGAELREGGRLGLVVAGVPGWGFSARGVKRLRWPWPAARRGLGSAPGSLQRSAA